MSPCQITQDTRFMRRNGQYIQKRLGQWVGRVIRHNVGKMSVVPTGRVTVVIPSFRPETWDKHTEVS